MPPTTGVRVDQAAPMGPPNYATKGLATHQPNPSLQPETGPANITYNVTFVDPYNSYSSYFPEIAAAVRAAGAAWARYLTGSASLEVEVVMDENTPRTTGRSATNGFVRNDGTRDILEQGAIYELRTGTDPNGTAPDIQIYIGPSYLTDQLWFDPDPSTRTAPIPANHLDAISVFIHELGHAFVFNGWMNGTNGQLPPTYMSTFDANVQFDGTNFYFIGPNAVATHGTSVPITFDNPFHLGNNSPRPGADLLTDLMNGVVYNYQTRYPISAVDLGVAKDAGVPLVPLTNWFLQNASTYQVAIWFMSDLTKLSSSYTSTAPPAGWLLVDAEQFGGATSPDLLFDNPSLRKSAIWYMNGSTRLSSVYGPSLPTGWTLLFAQDFNGDSKPDLFLSKPSTHQTAIWYLNGAVRTSTAYGPTLPAGWTVVGAARFNADDSPDLLLYQSSTHKTAIWYLSGVMRTSSLYGPTLPSGWAIGAVDDFNRDGKPDFALWNPGSRKTAVWHLNNNVLIGSGYGPNLPANWVLRSPK